MFRHGWLLTLICYSLLLPVKAEVTANLDLGAVSEYESEQASIGLSARPSVSGTFTTKDTQLTSQATLYSQLTNFSEFEPIQWQADNEIQTKLLVPSLRANASYSHEEILNLDSDVQTKQNRYQVGASYVNSSSAISTNTIQTNYQWSGIEAEQSSSDSESVTLSYQHSRLLQNQSQLILMAIHQDYLNDIKSNSLNTTVNKPLKNGTLISTLGLTKSEAPTEDSTSIMGSVIYTRLLPMNANLQLSVSRQRSDSSSLFELASVYDNYTSDQLFDTTTASSSFEFPSLDSRLTTTLAYQYSWIKSVFNDSLSADDEHQTDEIDLGSVEFSYDLSPQSNMTAGTQFSIIENTAFVTGDIRYSRLIAKRLLFSTGISFSDTASGVERVYASLNYRLGTGFSND